MPFDFSPHSNISPGAFKSEIDPYQQILPNFLAGQQQQQANRKKQLLQAAIGQIAQDPMMQKDPIMQGIMPLLQANPDMLEQVLPALIHARSRAATMKQQQPPVNTIYDQGTGQLQASPPVQGPPTQAGMPPASPPLGPGQVAGQMPYPSFVQRMASQAGRKDAQNKYEAVMTARTNQTMLPFEGAERTLDKLDQLYDQAQKAGEVGPGVPRAGQYAAGITGGKKFGKLFAYQRTKQELLHTLSTSLGVNRFNLAAMQQVGANLPNGTEDYRQGKKLLAQMRDSIHAKREAARRDLEYQGLILRGTMGLSRMGASETAPPEQPETPNPNDPASQFEE